MQKFLFTFLFTAFLANAFAQNYTKASDSDPKAKEVLENMRQKYEAYNAIETEFTLVIEEPEQPKETQKGRLVQQGKQYRLSLNGRTMVSDGKSVWLYVPKKKQVQINDVDEDAEEGSISSPQDLFKAYLWKDYIYVLSNEMTEGGKVVQQIEFKPLDKHSDYSKIRLTLEKKTLEVLSIKTFGKDGSRMTILVDKIKANPSVNAGTFTFAKSECSDCKWEDLRLD